MESAIEAIKKHKRFLVTAHVNLEGDSLGSQLAMKELLEALGKHVIIVDNDPVPAHYKFLPKADEVSNELDKRLPFDVAIVLDCPTLKRTGDVRKLFTKNKLVVNIDHHISNERFGDINWVCPNASSAGELVYRLFKAMGVPLTKEVALYLYIAILTDTGSFNYDNTSSITHEIAGELLGYGLEPALVSERVYEQRSVADLKLLGLVLSTLNVSKDGKVAYLVMTRDMLAKTGIDVSRSEGFINYARSIEGVKIAMMFRDDPKEKSKVHISFRSKGDIDVNGLAACFGGGGHVKASGCTVKGTIKNAEKKVLAKVNEVLYGRDITHK